jgi:acyl carrier protein
MSINRQTMLNTVLEALLAVAPEVETNALEPARPLRHQVDLDSMDWLNFLVSLHERFRVNIPEADYARLVSLNDVVDYLQNRLA